MASVTPYLTFAGNCEEAIQFYADVLDGDIVAMQRYGESPLETPAEFADKILHCVLAAEDVIIMASDAMPGQSVATGNAVSLSLDFESPDEQTDVFDALAVGGTVTMPLQETFWGARFGMVVDKYGTSWMLNYDADFDDDEDFDTDEEN